MRLRLLAASVILASSVSAADSGLLNLVMPGAQLIAGVNVAQVTPSPFGQFLVTESQQGDSVLAKLAQDTGFDPRRDLREILVAGIAGGDTWLVMARGTFDVPRIVEAAIAAGATAETYSGSQIVDWSKSQHPSVAFLDSTVAIVGKPDNVRAAIDRRSGPSVINSVLAAEVNTISAAEDAWFVSGVPVSTFGGQATGPLAMFNTVAQANGGVKFGANVAVNLKAVCQTAPDAAALAAGLQSIGALASGAGGQAGGLASILQNLNVAAAGTAVTLSLSIPEPQFEQLLKSGRSGTIGYDIH